MLQCIPIASAAIKDKETFVVYKKCTCVFSLWHYVNCIITADVITADVIRTKWHQDAIWYECRPQPRGLCVSQGHQVNILMFICVFHPAINCQ